jgi:phenylalanyl-tRNA synthetase alpha chain
VLGCGVIQQPILDKCDMSTKHGWAFGLGLERLAMVLFDIPDIRLFWTTDERFLSQFKDGEITKFQPYSKFPPCYKDIAFWLPENWEENNFAELVRNVAGDIVESVSLIDKFDNPKKGKTSHCYRINYRAMDRSLTNEEVDKLQEQVREQSASKLSVELR